MSAVVLSDVSHRFGTHWVLRRLNLRLPAQGRVFLTGDNGTGKTTLLRLMATALRPTLGRVALFGQDAQEALAKVRPRLTLLTHQHHFYAALSGLINLCLVAGLRGLAARPAQEAAQQALARVDLYGARHRALATYSAGMVRRLGLARVLLLAPELLLLDEPFSNLDAAGMQLVERVLGELAAQGTCWVMSTHDAARARHLCNAGLHLTLPGSAAPAPALLPLAAPKTGAHGVR